MFKWKAVIFTFIGGFVLSLIIGLIAGNPFGVVFLRSLLSGIVVGGVGMGVIFVFNKYFADFLVSKGEEPVEKDEREGVDIIIPEENPHSIIDGDTVEEVEEIVDEAGQTLTDSEVEPEAVEELENSMETKPDTKKSAEDTHSDNDDLLPDLDSLAIDSVETGRTSVSTHKANTETLGVETDPETLAKAVRSFMKKDEEG